VRNPLRSEAEAFRFLIVTIVVFAATAIATAVWGWVAGLLVFVLGAVLAVVFYYGKGGGEATVRSMPAAHPPDEHRLLVIANETVAGSALFDEIVRICEAHSKASMVLVVAPALPDRTHLWTSDLDSALAEAQARLDVSLANLAEAGIAARGEVGAEDPLVAFDDAYRTFGPDEAIISTKSPERSTWLERGVVDNARERFDLPITHVIGEDAAA
jgi:GABA permease